MFALPASLGIVGPKASALALGQIFTAISSGTSAYTVAIWGRSGDSISVVDNISTGGRGNTGQLAVSSTGIYLAKVNNTTTGSGCLQLYKLSGTWSQITSPTILQVGNGVAFSPDETYLAVGCDSVPRLQIFKRSGDDFSTTCTIVTAPTNNVLECTFHPSGNYLAGGIATTPYFHVYSRSSDTFTKMSNPATLPAGRCNGIHYNPAGDLLGVAQNSSPWCMFYYWNGSSLTAISSSNIDTLPTGTGNKIRFSPDGNYVAVAHAVSPFLSVYSISGSGTSTTFTKITLSNNPLAECNSVDWDGSSTYLAVSHTATSSVSIELYKLAGGTLSRVQQTDLPSGSVGPTALIWDIDR